MAYIQPNGTVNLIKGYHGDKDYNHTVHFLFENEQTNYFLNLTFMGFTNQMYHRYTSNSIRIPRTADTFFGCNYLMFKNTNFGNKWFYAFIDKIEYVNNNMCEIFYTIDVIQTWWFNFNMGECFVVREHTSTDIIGDEIIDENLELGDYIIAEEKVLKLNGSHTTTDAAGNTYNHNGFCYIVIATESYIVQPSGELYWQRGSTLVNNILVPFKYMYAFTPQELVNILTTYTDNQKVDALVSIIVTRNYDDSSAFHSEIYTPDIGTQYAFGGYAPKNNKMYTYPYVYMEVSDGLGSHADYKFELFNGTPSFQLDSAFITTSASLLSPINYRRRPIDYDSGISFDKYPDIPFSKDVYSSWLAQNKNQITANIQNMLWGTLVNTGTGALSSLALKNPVKAVNTLEGAISNAVSTENYARSVNAKIKDLKSFPPQATSHTTCSPLMISHAIDRFGYTFKVVSIRLDYARAIDNYFSMFGYAQHRVKQPNIKGGGLLRPSWNYIQTNGAIIHPNQNGMPAEIESVISDIFNRGITFWNKNVEIGNYSANNSPVI